MFQPVLVFDSAHPSPFVAHGLRMGFRLVDIRDSSAKVRDNNFPIVIIRDYPVKYRVLDEVPNGRQRFRFLEFVGEMVLDRERKGTLRNVHDPIGFLAYCFDTDIDHVRYHEPSGGFTIRQQSARTPAARMNTAMLREAIIEAPVSSDCAGAFLARLEAEGILGSDTIDVDRLARAVDRIGGDPSFLGAGLDYGVLLGVTVSLDATVSATGRRGAVNHE